MTEDEIIKIGDSRWRKIEDCDDISDSVKKDVSELKTDVAVTKSILKGVLCVVSVIAAFIIPACLKIIMGVPA